MRTRVKALVRAFVISPLDYRNALLVDYIQSDYSPTQKPITIFESVSIIQCHFPLTKLSNPNFNPLPIQ